MKNVIKGIESEMTKLDKVMDKVRKAYYATNCENADLSVRLMNLGEQRTILRKMHDSATEYTNTYN